MQRISDFSSRLKEYRDINALTLADLEKITHTPSQTLNRYELGQRTPKVDVANEIAESLGVNALWLQGYDVPMFSKIDLIEDAACRPYPVIGEVAAGFGCEAIEEETGDYEHIPLEWLRGHSPDNFFVLRVKGDSMYPDFQEGDCVLVHRQSSVDSGTVAVMLYDGEIATLKKVRYKKNESWVELIPRNPEYQTKRIENWDLNECRVLGEVRRLIRVVK